MAAVTGSLAKSVERLASEKAALIGKERQLVDSLNRALQRMGYRIVPMTEPAVRRRGRPPKNSVVTSLSSVPRRRGRPPGSKNKAKSGRGPGRPRKAKA